MTDDLVDILGAAAYDDSLRAVHLTGAGEHFCTGADWVATNSGQRPRPGDLVRRIPHTANRIIELVATVHLPVVVTVRGWAVGLGGMSSGSPTLTTKASPLPPSSGQRPGRLPLPSPPGKLSGHR